MTLLLIVWGGVVRVSDSGLGCGPAGSGSSGWPFCDGRVVPLTDATTLIEYSHRALAGIVLIGVIALALMVHMRLRSNGRAMLLSYSAVGTVLVQAALGGLTVEENLHELLVAAHLLLAMALLGLLLALYRLLSPSREGPARAGTALKVLTTATAVAVLATIVIGGYLAGTEGHGRSGEAAGEGAHYACGMQFPACNDSFLPFGQSEMVNIQLAHRLAMYIAVVLILALSIYVLARARARRNLITASVGLGMLAVQVLLGALNVLLAEEAWLVVAHLFVGTLLWSWSVLFVLDTAKAPRVEYLTDRGTGRAEAAVT